MSMQQGDHCVYAPMFIPAAAAGSQVHAPTAQLLVERQVKAAEQHLRTMYPLTDVPVRDPLDPKPFTNVHTEALVVYDPATRLGYLVRASEVLYNNGKALLWKATYNGSTEDNVNRTGERKRFFLCMLFQDRRCKGYQRCNSIHMDPTRVAQLRAMYHARGQPVQRPNPASTMSDSQTVTIPDPEDPSRRLSIRAGSLLETVGRGIALRGALVALCPQSISSVQCPARGSCKLLHLRHDVARNFWVSCCARHGGLAHEDPTLMERVQKLRIAVRFRGTRVEIDPIHLGITDGLKVLLREKPTTDVFDLPRGKFCHRHANRECKHGSRCCNLHICRKAFDNYFPATPTEPSNNNTALTTPLPRPQALPPA
eukprot:Hpha_TRINITY_DN8242_c0_g1::TRINITY_DN8242_c0_g1_i1::g.111853::m.111853